MEEWKQKEFGELYQVPSRNGLSKPSRVRGTGYKMINMGELFSNDRIYDIDMELVPLTDSEKEKAKVEEGDLLFARQSLVASGAGKCSIVMETSELTVFESHLIRVRLNQKIADPMFYYYYFKSSKSPMRTIIEHCVQAGIKASDLEKLVVRVPPIEEQRKISEALSRIDDKIELNIEVNKNLQKQAHEFYKAWFVSFEAFGGEMPSTWNVTKLGDIATIKTDSFSPAKNPTVMLEHYSIPTFDEKKYPVFELASNVKSNKYILTNNSVLISKLNPDIKRVWRPMCISEFAVCSTEFIIFEANNPTYKDYVFSVIDSAAFSDWMCAHTTGSTNSRQRTTPSTTLEFQIALPNQEVISDFCKIVTPMYDMIAQNICENQKLAAFRDSLLPKLMTGELDVSYLDL